MESEEERKQENSRGGLDSTEERSIRGAASGCLSGQGQVDLIRLLMHSLLFSWTDWSCHRSQRRVTTSTAGRIVLAATLQTPDSKCTSHSHSRPFPKIFKIFRHIEFLDICMEH